MAARERPSCIFVKPVDSREGCEPLLERDSSAHYVARVSATVNKYPERPASSPPPPGHPRGELESSAQSWHKPVFITFLLAWLLHVALACFEVRIPRGAGWLEAMLPVSAVATTLVGLGRWLPLQNIVAITATIGGIAFAMTWVSVQTGVPFGSVLFRDTNSVPRPGHVPWWIPLMWVALVLNARGAARLVLRPWRDLPHFALLFLGVTCGLLLLFDVGLGPVATQDHGYWLWIGSSPGWSWRGVPLTNFFGWTVCSLLMVVFTFVWLAHKRPVALRPDYHPLVVWLLLVAWLAAGDAAVKAWDAFAVTVTSGLVVLMLAVKARNWKLKEPAGPRVAAWPAQSPKD